MGRLLNFVCESWLRSQYTGFPVTDPEFDSWAEVDLSHSLLGTLGLCKSNIALLYNNDSICEHLKVKAPDVQ